MRDSQLNLLQGSDEYFPALVDAINQAKLEIRLETYIFDFNEGSLSVAKALENAAKKGVSVYVLVDGVGTPNIPLEWQIRWQTSGVKFKVFDPVGPGALWFPSRWRRLHRKLCVIDQIIGFCGGINILDDHYNPHTQSLMRESRLDFAVQIVGYCVIDILKEMQRTWYRLDLVQEFRQTGLVGTVKGIIAKNDFALNFQDIKHKISNKRHKRRSYSRPCSLVLRDNLSHRNSIANAYIKAIDRSRFDICIASAFFLPQDRMLDSLIKAAKRGVSVTLLLQGHYEFVLPYRAARQIYGKLLDAGVQIVEYQLSYLHAKVACVDSIWSTVGSSNLDPLSLLLAREANLVIKDAVFNRQLKDQLSKAILNGGVFVDKTKYCNRSVGDRFLDKMSFWLMRLAIFISGKHYQIY